MGAAINVNCLPSHSSSSTLCAGEHGSGGVGGRSSPVGRASPHGPQAPPRCSAQNPKPPHPPALHRCRAHGPPLRARGGRPRLPAGTQRLALHGCPWAGRRSHPARGRAGAEENQARGGSDICRPGVRAPCRLLSSRGEDRHLAGGREDEAARAHRRRDQPSAGGFPEASLDAAGPRAADAGDRGRGGEVEGLRAGAEGAAEGEGCDAGRGVHGPGVLHA